MLPQLDGMECVLGLDSGTSTGYAVLTSTGETLALGALDFSKSSRYVRWTAMRQALGILLDQYTPTLTVIEGYGYGNAFSLATLVEYGTVLRLLLLDRSIPFVEIPPLTLKAFITKGTAKKDEMRLRAYQLWGVEHASHDAVDAYVAAQLARAILGMASRTAAQTKLLNKCYAATPHMVSC